MSRRRELASCRPASFSSGNCLGPRTVTVNHSSGINDLGFFFSLCQGSSVCGMRSGIKGRRRTDEEASITSTGSADPSPYIQQVAVFHPC